MQLVPANYKGVVMATQQKEAPTEVMARQRPPKQRRESGWIHKVVTRWSDFVWTWLVRVLTVLFIVAVVWAVVWMLSTDRGVNQANTRALEARAFGGVTQIDAPQRGASLPLVGGLFAEGSYNAAAGRCSFVVTFDGGVPVVNYATSDNSGTITVRDADPTRLRQEPTIQRNCF